MQAEFTKVLLRHHLEIAEIAARRAGEVVRSYWDRAFDVHEKREADLVTIVDQQSEDAIRDVLARHSPDVAILAEEGGASSQDANQSHWWYVDPLDGTTNLAHRVPYVAISIALMDEHRPLVGVVYDPINDRLFRAARGQGAELLDRTAGRRIQTLRVSSCDSIPHALLSTGFPTTRRTPGPHDNIDRFLAFIPRVQAMRRAGAAALDLAGVAAGWYDGFWEPGLHAWDTAAGWLLVEEAGGRVTLFDGSAYDVHIPEIVASNGALHQAMIDILATASQ